MLKNKLDQPSVYKIDDCEYKHSQLELTRNGKNVKLSAKVGDLLLLFLQHSQDVLSFEDAIELIWDGNEGVGRKAYTNGVWMIRKSFKDLGIEDDIFESIPKVGYRFLPDVSEVTSFQSKLSANKLIASALFFILILVSYIFVYQQGDASNQVTNTSYPKDKITNYEGVEEHISVSPTGDYVSFSWAQQNMAQQVYLKAINNEEDNELRLVSTGKGDNVSSAWSPSEKSLAYVNIGKDSNCKLKVRDLLLSSEEIVSNSCYYVPYYRVVSWSSTDENILAYSKKLDDRVAIYTIDLSSKIETQRTFPKVGEVDYLPNLIGNELYFVRDHQTDYNFSLLKVSTNNDEHRFEGNFIGIVDFDVDTSTGQIYINMSVNNELKIYVLDASGNINNVIPTSGLPSSLDYSEKLKALFISEHISREYIALVSLSNGSINRRISSSSRDMYGSYISNKDEIAFLSNRDKNWGVWLSSSKGSINLSKGMGDASIPRVSPDGKKIVTRIRNKDNVNAFYLIDESNKFSKLDINDLQLQYANWSKDSETIYFTAIQDDKLGMFSYQLASQKIQRLTDTGELYMSPFSNEELLVSRQNTNGLWLYNIKNHQFKLVTKELASFDFASFFSQDNAIYYIQRTTQEDQVMRITQNSHPEVVLSFANNSIKKFFGISAATNHQILVTFKIANEADVSKIGIK